MKSFFFNKNTFPSVIHICLSIFPKSVCKMGESFNDKRTGRVSCLNINRERRWSIINACSRFSHKYIDLIFRSRQSGLTESDICFHFFCSACYVTITSSHICLWRFFFFPLYILWGLLDSNNQPYMHKDLSNYLQSKSMTITLYIAQILWM
jgi:hypothetical protein